MVNCCWDLVVHPPIYYLLCVRCTHLVKSSRHDWLSAICKTYLPSWRWYLWLTKCNMAPPSWKGQVGTHSQSQSLTQSKGNMTDVASDSSSEEIEDSEVIDPVILSLSIKEPLIHRSTSVIEGEELRASKAEVSQQATSIPLRRGISLSNLPLDDGKGSELDRVSHRWCSHQGASDDLQSFDSWAQATRAQGELLLKTW